VSPDDTTTGTLLNAPEAASEHGLPVGTRLADFEITGIIGEGGFGIVYLAIDHSLRRTVAIKEYMPGSLAARGADQRITVRSKRHQETFDTGLKSFINEARLLAQFDHPALIKVYRFWEQNNTAYMTMRYYEGQTLKNIIRNDPSLVTEAWLKRMLKPILEALEALYSVRILHRDISPDNIMIQTNGEAVLLDFGSARQIIGKTNALTVILKPGYAPIEQYADDSSMQQGPWTDIYSLSAVVYSAIVKKPPPTSVARMLKDPLEPLENSAHAGFSNAFLSAINKGLCVTPEGRPQSIEEFRRLLGIDPFAPASANGLQTSLSPVRGNKGLIDDVNGLDDITVIPVSELGPAGRQTGMESLPNRAKRPARHLRMLLIAGIVLAAGFTGALFVRGDSTAAQSASAVPIEPKSPAPQSAPSIPVEPQKSATLSASSIPIEPKSPAPPLKKTARGKHGKQTARAVKSRRLAAGTGNVKLMINPWGTVLVDGVSQGISPPLKNLSLPEGRHQITIVNPNFPAYVTKIEVKKNKLSSIRYNFAP
jgi:serine/threonine protein kinase